MFTQSNLDELEGRLDGIVQEDAEAGIFRARRDMFTDEELFELEIKHVFEGNWIYMAHESQIPNPGDYFTLTMGRTPVVITRDKDGQLNALVNACSHRGAQLCRFKRRNQKTFTCPFHGWTFSNTGKLLKVKDPNGAGYPEQFNTDGSHDLTKVARFENYRGFLFGSLNADVAPLEEYLGEARKMIDMIVDQSDEGLEVLRGSSTYTFDGNWKLQAENGADGYHVSAVHWNYVATTSHRTVDGKEDKIKATDASKWAKQKGGFHSYVNGHLLLWTTWADSTNRPNYPRLAEWTEKYGVTKAEWMVGVLRNLCLYPNVFLMDQFSSQIRVFRPVSVDKTEVTIYCIAPKGESQEARSRRIRQYEDFFNASGMATPDDTEEFRATQRGYAGAAHAKWNDICRGATQWIHGPDEDAKALGVNPILSGARTEDEGLFVIQHKQWSERMAQAIAKERASASDAQVAAE
ncbi:MULTISPECIES: benzoate 1,2-dioxygenase large subunit [unclassified Roseovarius]|uniref:benzoate 1,2-dioxygenase large subunit n=2 Tax=Roseovarius TaxID=74030 RepID=UPI00006868E5|nr:MULTISPECIES: benzoate 1,2-dioxygenase large subunit [unclassified Roseovarius]EAQ23010.1 ring hydroxylating dioxygenase, alpha subunit: Rieske (2Fe-2S) region protein [Roseovarius sp. 217]KJS45722.1 MAG: benzene 1,2-dioxygenase [Roseovarius sp. BRH_c41]